MARSESLGSTMIPVPFSAVVAAAMTESVTPAGRDWICSVNWNWNKATLPSAETRTPGTGAPSTISGPYGGASATGRLVGGWRVAGGRLLRCAVALGRSRAAIRRSGEVGGVDDVVESVDALDGPADGGQPLRGPKAFTIRGYEDDASLTAGGLGQLLGQLVQHPLRIGALDPHLRTDAYTVGGQQDHHDPREQRANPR